MALRVWSGETLGNGNASGDLAPAQAPRGIDADRAQERQVADVDLEGRLTGGQPRRGGEGERLQLAHVALAVHQKVEGVALFADLAQRAVDLRRFRDRLGKGAPQLA